MTFAADRAARPPQGSARGFASVAFRWRMLPFVVATVLAGLQLAAILERNGGRLTYSLDDPYIHLALSENLARGHYGIEPREPSSPSSSILWPFLLVPGASWAIHEVLPLAINLVALWVTIALLARLARCSRLHKVRNGEAYVAGLLSLLVWVLNLTGLAFTGMEHGLQVTLAVAVVLGMIAVDRGGPTPTYLVVAAIVGPLVRYESAALTVAAGLLLLLRGRFRAAALIAVACGVLVGSFSIFLVGLGLEPLPGPVLENLEVTGSPSSTPMASILGKLKLILTKPQPLVLASLTGMLLALALASPRDIVLLLCGAVAPLLHLSFGSFGGFARYEIYVLASTSAFLIYGLRRSLRRLVRDRGVGISLLATSAVIVPVLSGYAVISVLTPQAAHNVYQQQDQMHRFVTEHYLQPVAVNDLGLVSYRNPEFVLDLWGLCSQEMLRARLDGDPDWPAAFVAREGIELAMIYDTWFAERIPPSWRRVAELRLLGQRITPASDRVSFYLTRPGSAESVLEALRSFRTTLPADAVLDIFEP